MYKISDLNVYLKLVKEEQIKLKGVGEKTND